MDKEKTKIICAAIIGGSIVVATLLHLICNRYTIVNRGGGNAFYIVNKITGSAKSVLHSEMRDVKPKKD